MADYEVESTASDESGKARPANIDEALRRLKLAKETRKAQLDREKAALRFQVPELQWDDAMKQSRQKATVDGVEIPARPMLSIPKLNQPIQLVLNQEKAAHLGVNVSPLNEEASDDTAEVIRDLYRREEQRSRAGLARSWGFDRAVKAGFGCYRIDTAYDDESSNPFDQKIVWRRMLYQDAAYFDPTAEEPDWCDGEWAFVLSWLPCRKYERRYGKKAGKVGGETLEALTEAEPDWVKLASDEGKEDAVLVAEYWRKEYQTKTWVILDDGSFAYEDEIPEGRSLHPDPKVNQRRREVDVPTVVWSVLGPSEAGDIIEVDGPQDWNGKYIPLIPVVGVELQPFDSERRWQGVIEPSMDAQKLFNYAASSAVELAATETKAPYIMYDGQDEGFEDMWRQSAVRNFPALKVNKDVTLAGGTPAPLPQRAQVDVGRLGPSMQLLEQADRFIQASTTTLDQSRIEQMGRRRVAHQTIEALQDQSDAGNSHFLHNLATISMPYEAKVVIDLMAKIYDRPGRVARLLDQEDNERTVLLNAPFTVDTKTKRPQPAQAGQQGAQQYDLRKGAYGVHVSIGKSWQTRLQQGADEIGQILTGSPDLMPLIGATYFKFRDFPGAKEVASLLKKVRAKQFPGLDQEDGQPPDVDTLQAENAALKEQAQAMQQQLQQAAQQLETDVAKQKATIEKAQIDSATKVKVEQADNATEVFLQRMEQHFELMMARMEQAHEQRMAAKQAEIAASQAEQAHAHSLVESHSQPAPKNGGGR